jgi:hypothetical protein
MPISSGDKTFLQNFLFIFPACHMVFNTAIPWIIGLLD